jgi:D-alanine-D-alanine ligase
MRITVLTYLEEEGGKPDVVVPQVAEALKEKGHEVDVLGIYDDVNKLIVGLEASKPDVIFNLMEMFGENLFGAVAVVGLLDLLGFTYTGGGPGEFYLREDKSLTKKLLAFEEDVPYPRFMVFSVDSELETGGNVHLPVFVKPLRGDASIGITGKSLCRTAKEMIERISAIQDEVNDSALVEEYIDGREFYVGVLGNRNPVAFPAVEVDFSGLPADLPKIMDTKAKWSKRSVEYKGTKSVMAQISDELQAKLKRAALAAYRALRVRDYGRIDMRLSSSGVPYVIEVNASCYLEKESEFAMAAAAGGIDYPTLVDRIVEKAVERFERRARRRQHAKHKVGKPRLKPTPKAAPTPAT